MKKQSFKWMAAGLAALVVVGVVWAAPNMLQQRIDTAKDAVNAAMKCLVAKDYKGFAKYFYVDDLQDAAAQSNEIAQNVEFVEKIYTENPVTRYTILSEKKRKWGSSLFHVEIQMKSGKENTKIYAAKNFSNEWKIYFSNDKPSDALDVALSCLVMKNYAGYAKCVYIDESMSNQERRETRQVSIDAVKKLFKEGSFDDYEILGERIINDDNAVVKVKTVQTGSVYTDEVHMIRNKFGIWQINENPDK